VSKIFLILLIILVISGAFVFGKIICSSQKQLMPASTTNIIKITSPAFTNNQPIPAKFSCDGEGINPPLDINDIPAKAKSLALIVDDPDAPAGLWTHWLVWNINPQVTAIKENSVPSGSLVGKNTSGNSNYDGPCPPSGQHRYFFKFYALDTVLNLASGSERPALENAMKGHIIDNGELMGTYKR
jgi:Raf kinase inhibitor-like YbhB/YbcL family protein